MLVSNTMVIYHGIFNLRKSRYCSKLPWYFYNTGQTYHGILTLEKGGTMVNYCSIIITLAPGADILQPFCKFLLVTIWIEVPYHVNDNEILS
jgi:hypothetical protein